MGMIILVSGWSAFATRHWVVGGIIASLLWFLAGQQSFSNKKPDLAILWQLGGVIVIVALCGWAAVEGEWIGLVCGIAVLYMEVRSIRHISATQKRQR
jgi:hypothetical protein